MTNSIVSGNRIRQFGGYRLGLLLPKSEDVRKWRDWLAEYDLQHEYPDDLYVWLTCVLALEAADSGNLGVGAILVDRAGDVVALGSNRVFHPYFRSDLHAEMATMNDFEETHRDITNLEGYTLYTSLEPCPMCTVRLIISGVNTILYAASSERGGMVRKINDLPRIWVELAQRQTFGLAKCSKDLAHAASEISLTSLSDLDKIVRGR